MHFYLKLAKNNRIGILYMLLTETMFVTTENPGPLLLRSQILQIRAECGPGRNCDHDTGKGVGAFGWRKTLILETTAVAFRTLGHNILETVCCFRHAEQNLSPIAQSA